MIHGTIDIVMYDEEFEPTYMVEEYETIGSLMKAVRWMYSR